MATYTFKWQATTNYSTQVEADSEAEAHEDLQNDIKMNTNFEDDIVNQDFIIPSESVRVQFGKTTLLDVLMDEEGGNA